MELFHSSQNAHGAFTKVENTLDHDTSCNIIQFIYTYNVVQLEIDNKSIIFFNYLANKGLKLIMNIFRYIFNRKSVIYMY